jgi:hypothetical protein
VRDELDRALKSGVRVAVVAAVVGLLVLLLARAARSQEASPDASGAVAEDLLDPGTRTSAERAQTAHRILAEDRRARMGRAAYELLHVGLRASIQASPRRLLGSVRRLGKEIWSWRHRSAAEDAALALLEPDVESGEAAAESIALYEELRERERKLLIRSLAERADAALDAGDVWRAGRHASRLEALGADPDRLARLRARIARSQEREADPEIADATRPIADPLAPEIALAAALLVERDAHVLALASGERAADRLARAAALHGIGRRGEALTELTRLASGEGPEAETARAWLAHPEIHPEAELDRLWDQVSIERALGRVGGDRLARNGRRISRSAYGAWQDSVEPLNLALGAPARVLTGWQPEARAYREFAARYLERFPEGPIADETRSRLAVLGALDPARQEWRDGRLVLPPARTHWRRSVEPYLIASGEALQTAAAPLVDELLLPDGALLLSVVRGGHDEGLEAAQARALTAALAAGIERGELHGLGARGGDVLAALQRIDLALDDDGVLVAEPWVWKRGSASDVAALLLHGGSTQTSGDIRIRREDEGIDLRRSLVGAHLECPLEVACVDQKRELDSALYARIDEDGELRLGAKAGYGGAMLALEMGDSGPRTSLVLPLGYWLGVGRWVPVEAHVQLGLDGLDVSPRLGPLLPEPSGVVVK